MKTSRGAWFSGSDSLGLTQISSFPAGGKCDHPAPCLSFPTCSTGRMKAAHRTTDCGVSKMGLRLQRWVQRAAQEGKWEG